MPTTLTRNQITALINNPEFIKKFPQINSFSIKRHQSVRSCCGGPKVTDRFIQIKRFIMALNDKDIAVIKKILGVTGSLRVAIPQGNKMIEKIFK
jgi:hypothetical protein